MAFTFDTHAAIKTLIQEGVKEKQAEAFVKVIQESKDNNAATKADLNEFEQRLRAEISTLRIEVANVKYDLIKWILPFLIGIIAAIFFK